MKVSVFIPSLNGGGAERVTSYLVNSLSKKNDVYLFMTSSRTTNDYLISDKIIVYDNTTNVSIYHKLKEINPDLIVIMFAPMIAKIFPSIFLGAPNAKKIISERNDPKVFSGKRYVKFIYQYLFKKFDGAVFQTKDAMDFYNKSKGNFGIIIENPLDSSLLPEPQINDRRKEIVSVGRLHSQKNQEMLIYAFKKIQPEFPDYKLIIYGEGPLRKSLEKLIQKLELQNVVFLPGFELNIPAKINGASLFVLSSNYEGMSNALIESMAMGIPTISTDCPCGGSRALIKNEINGLLVPINNIESLANSMKTILSDTNLQSKLANNSIKIRQDLAVDIIIERWTSYLNYLVSEDLDEC